MRDRLIEILHRIYSTDFKGDYESGINDIADHLLAEGVIVPPCKIGEKLYDVTEFVEGRDCPDIYELQDNVLYVEKTKGGNILFSYDGVYIDHDAISKTIFLAREQAEKALERSENGKS